MARNLRDKRKCRDEDARLRAQIAALLKTDGWDTATARMLASWDPYDQNASAPFFESEWMFGLSEGFSIVLGNPPFGAVIPEHLVELIRAKYRSIANSLDSFIMFIERAVDLLDSSGTFSYIVPSGWVSTPSSGSCGHYSCAASDRWSSQACHTIPSRVHTSIQWW